MCDLIWNQESLQERMGVDIPKQAMDFLQLCLVMDPNKRASCEDLLNHSYFDGFREWFEIELAVSHHNVTTTLWQVTTSKLPNALWNATLIQNSKSLCHKIIFYSRIKFLKLTCCFSAACEYGEENELWEKAEGKKF